MLDYLDGLRDAVRERAEEYVRKAPAQIDTPYRRAIAARLGWTPIPAVEQPPDEPQIRLPPGQNFRRIEITDAIEAERALAVAPYRFTVAHVGQFGPITKVKVEPMDDHRPVDEALEGRTAQWHGGYANVLSAVPKESVLNLSFVAGGQPLQGNPLSVRPADYLERLAIEWRTNSAAAAALAWLDQHNGDAVTPSPALDSTNFPHLRKQQKNAFTLVGRTRGFLWGPPGTGKTTTLGCLLAEYALSHPNHRALLIACSNTAVDHCILAVDKALDDLQRVGLTVDETRHACKRIGLHFDPDRVVERTHLLPEIPDELVQRLSEVEARRPDPANPQACYQWKLAYEEIQSEIRAVLRKDLFATRVAAMTATRAIYTISELRLLDYDLVVFDEASQLGLAQAAMLAPLGKRVLFAGDPKQLAPIVQAEDLPAALHWLGDSPFSLQKPAAGSMCFLDEQNRMAEPICRVVSEQFYGGRLRVAETAIQDAEWLQRRAPADVAGLGQANVHVRPIQQEGCPANSGWYRPLSCEFICQTVACLVHHQDPSSILVLTPFRAQRQNIRTRLLQLGVHGVDVSTVHRAQGSERHTVFFDPVRGEKLAVFGDYGERLINVALSRAQTRLVITLSPGDLENPILQPLQHKIEHAKGQEEQGGPPAGGPQHGVALLASVVLDTGFPIGYQGAHVFYRGVVATVVGVLGGGTSFRLGWPDDNEVAQTVTLNTDWCRHHPDLL